MDTAAVAPTVKVIPTRFVLSHTVEGVLATVRAVGTLLTGLGYLIWGLVLLKGRLFVLPFVEVYIFTSLKCYRVVILIRRKEPIISAS